MTDKITEAMVEKFANVYYGGGVPHLMTDIRAALSASLALLPQEGEIGVKELEWIETGADFIAGSVAGEYEILRTPEAWTAFRNGQGLSRHNNSPDDAKSAAQSDYEARIRSALSLPLPVQEKPVPSVPRWRIFEAATGPGYWGIELEDAGNDDEPILYPIKAHRDTVSRIVDAHNNAATSEGQAE